VNYNNLKDYVDLNKFKKEVEENLEKIKGAAIAEYKLLKNNGDDIKKVIPGVKVDLRQTASYKYSGAVEELEQELKIKKETEKVKGTAIKIPGNESLAVTYL